MRLTALGARQAIGTVSGVSGAIKVDAFAIALESEATEILPEVGADVSRLRLGLEGSQAVALGGIDLQTRAEVGARLDKGDAATGAGVEIGGGLAWTDPTSRVQVEARGRYLLVHEASGLRDWGASLNVRMSPDPSGAGLSLALSPVLGQAQSGVQTLWQATNFYEQVGVPGASPVARLNLSIGYGVPVAVPTWGPGLVTPFGNLSLSGVQGHQLRMGSQMALWGLSGSGAAVEVYGERRGGAAGPSPHVAIPPRVLNCGGGDTGPLCRQPRSEKLGHP